jgi:hypothetical protein
MFSYTGNTERNVQKLLRPITDALNTHQNNHLYGRTAIEWDYGILPPSSASIKGLLTDNNV